MIPTSRVRRWLAFCFVVIVFLTCIWIAIPKIHELRRYAANGETRGQLGLFRQAISDYKSQKGKFPTSLSDMGIPLPLLHLFDTPHVPNREIRNTTLHEVRDSGQWLYDNQPEDSGFGTLIMDCSHSDDRGRPWSSY